MVYRFTGLANVALLLDPVVAALPNEDKALLMRDFALLRRHILFTFKIKLAFWLQLPWAFAGLAHRNVAKARKLAEKLLRLAEKITTWNTEHIVTQALAI
jgi:hypothetical protein